MPAPRSSTDSRLVPGLLSPRTPQPPAGPRSPPGAPAATSWCPHTCRRRRPAHPRDRHQWERGGGGPPAALRFGLARRRESGAGGRCGRARSCHCHCHPRAHRSPRAGLHKGTSWSWGALGVSLPATQQLVSTAPHMVSCARAAQSAALIRNQRLCLNDRHMAACWKQPPTRHCWHLSPQPLEGASGTTMSSPTRWCPLKASPQGTWWPSQQRWQEGEGQGLTRGSGSQIRPGSRWCLLPVSRQKAQRVTEGHIQLFCSTTLLC